MPLHSVDIAIILAYFAVTLGIGFWISRRAAGNLRSYFLGDNSLAWYTLGLSNASGMFDISGTMLMVYWLFAYGAKSVWIPWGWPVFNQVFLMVYLSVWLRRSGAMTGAEWINFRFGHGPGATLAHLVVVVFALVNVVAFLAYGFIGIGKFSANFLPWQLSTDPSSNELYYGLLVTAVTTLYVVKGGMFSVVCTEVMQYILMTTACLWVGWVAMRHVSPADVMSVTPSGWSELFFGKRLGLDWSPLFPELEHRIQAVDGWEIFSAFVGMAFVKGCLQSLAGPAPNYDMQRVLSARTPKEAAMMSGFVNVVLLVPRYMLITGLAVLILVFFSSEIRTMGATVDFESLLPFAMREILPVGLRGLLIAALLAAFMSTYAATVNAAPAYLVNDIYKRYIRAHDPPESYLWMSYACSLAVVILGTAVGLYSKSLNDLVQWIWTAFGGGYAAANVLKWHWWRFNGYGYFAGMLVGLLAAGIVPWYVDQPTVLGGLPEIVITFPLVFISSLGASIAVSLLTRPDDESVLMKFYLQVRPWGLWEPVRKAISREQFMIEPNREFARDATNILVGLAWQTGLTATGIYLVLKDWKRLGICLAVVFATSWFLKRNWFDKLRNFPPGVLPPATDPLHGARSSR